LRRPWEERAREGWATFILSVAPCAHRTREGVRSAACGPAHPVDGSRPHSRARRIFLNGESIGARRCARLLACSCAHPLPIASNRYTLFAAVLRPPSVRCLQPRRQLGWPLRSSVCSCRYDVHACMLCTVCGARVHGLRPNVCLCRCSLRRFTGDARAELGSTFDPDNDLRCF
jgi:hypothetical protein